MSKIIDVSKIKYVSDVIRVRKVYKGDEKKLIEKRKDALTKERVIFEK